MKKVLNVAVISIVVLSGCVSNTRSSKVDVFQQHFSGIWSLSGVSSQATSTEIFSWGESSIDTNSVVIDVELNSDRDWKNLLVIQEKTYRIIEPSKLDTRMYLAMVMYEKQNPDEELEVGNYIFEIDSSQEVLRITNVADHPATKAQVSNQTEPDKYRITTIEQFSSAPLVNVFRPDISTIE